MSRELARAYGNLTGRDFVVAILLSLAFTVGFFACCGWAERAGVIGVEPVPEAQ